MGCWLILTWHYIYIWRVQKSRVMRIPLNHPTRGWPWINIETTMVTWGSPTSRNPHAKMKNEAVAYICNPRNKKTIFYIEGVSKVSTIYDLLIEAPSNSCVTCICSTKSYETILFSATRDKLAVNPYICIEAVYIYMCVYIHIHTYPGGFAFWS